MEKIGFIKHNGKVVVVDPCYNSNVMKFCGKQLAMDKGTYDVFIQKSGGTVTGVLLIQQNMVSQITQAVHPNDSYWCSVDAGCVMLADNICYLETHNENGVDDEWYDREVISFDTFTFPDDNSVIVRSGHGDGEYPVYKLYAGDKLVGCCVKFLDFVDEWWEPIKTDLDYILE